MIDAPKHPSASGWETFGQENQTHNNYMLSDMWNIATINKLFWWADRTMHKRMRPKKKHN